MRHDHENLSSGNVDTNGGFHNVKSLRDLESNWEVNLAKSLEDYLLKICFGEIVGDDDGHCLSVNFVEEKRTTQEVYQQRQRKMLMMKRMIHFGSQRKSLVVTFISLLFCATYRDASLTQFVKAPAKLVVLEGDCLDSTGDSGELESYLLATCDIYQDFIMLDSCDAVAVDSFLNNDDTVGKGLNNSCRGNYVGSKNQKSFLSPTRCFAGTANKFSARKNQDANFYVTKGCEMTQKVEPEFDPGSYNGDCDMPDNYDDNHGVNFNRRQGVNSRKCPSLASEFPLARLHGTISSDLNDIKEKKYCAMKKQGDSESLFEKLWESRIRGEKKDYNCVFGPNVTDLESH
ncbi:hypothetical protein MTR67_003435 [Solanum verrucosum]|uniref:Uncharacterized protein n=1 Tax=Solanum verrucosum TaxID=315347 RepID=A0AAF0PVK6_SOLVR|nr:hypothetical protein MTR67_003435 [Solanum verrucosum]